MIQNILCRPQLVAFGSYFVILLWLLFKSKRNYPLITPFHLSQKNVEQNLHILPLNSMCTYMTATQGKSMVYQLQIQYSQVCFYKKKLFFLKITYSGFSFLVLQSMICKLLQMFR